MKLNENDLKAMSRRVDEIHTNRSQANSEDLRILVNGRELGSLTPLTGKSVSLNLNDEADMIEVRTAPRDGNHLLATHFIDYSALLSATRPIEYSTRLKSGQKISFQVSPARTALDNSLHFKLGVDYQETNLLRAARLEFRRIGHTIRNSGVSAFIPQRQALMAMMSLVLIGCTAVLYVTQNRQLLDLANGTNDTVRQEITLERSEPAAIASAREAVSEQPPLRTEIQEFSKNTISKRRRQESGSVEIPVYKPSASSSSSSSSSSSWGSIMDIHTRSAGEDIATRGGETEKRPSLLSLRSIHVRLKDQSVDGDQLTSLIKAELSINSSELIASDIDSDADLIIQIDKDQGNILVKLIDKQSKIIWPSNGNDHRKYSGTYEVVAKQIVADLTDATRR